MSSVVLEDRAQSINRRWSELKKLAHDGLAIAIEVGGELAKAKVEIGRDFRAWVDENLDMSGRRADHLISLHERRDQISGCSSIQDALTMIAGSRQEEWVYSGYDEYELPLSEADPQPDHIEILSNEIHPMFLLDPVQKAKWHQIDGVQIYRTVISGKMARVAGTRELLLRGNEQGITRLPEDILSLDQGNQQRRDGIRKEDAWVAREWTDKVMGRLADDINERGQQLVQFLSNGMATVQRQWIEQRLGVDLLAPGDKLVDAVWALLLVRADDDVWPELKTLAGVDKQRIQRNARNKHRQSRQIKSGATV